MQQELEAIREQQRNSWNKFSPGWKKWDDLFMDFLKPMGDEIIRQLNPESDDNVLDIAAGTGEPGLTIARLVKNGKVIITDLAEDMIAIAKANAEAKGIKNIETAVCDVTELPFPDNHFDAISCRFGFMFFPDMQLAAKEMARVLKPGGRIATSVWNVAEKNFWITATMDALNRNIEMTPPVPGAPGMFRCAKEGVMEEIFTKAGLKNVSVTEVPGSLKSKTADTYWKVLTEVAAPIVSALSTVDDAVKDKIRKEVCLAVNNRYPQQPVHVEGSSLVIYGEK